MGSSAGIQHSGRWAVGSTRELWQRTDWHDYSANSHSTGGDINTYTDHSYPYATYIDHNYLHLPVYSKRDTKGLFG